MALAVDASRGRLFEVAIYFVPRLGCVAELGTRIGKRFA